MDNFLLWIVLLYLLKRGGSIGNKELLLCLTLLCCGNRILSALLSSLNNSCSDCCGCSNNCCS
ncbi:MAG TPA: hypothetical protein H9728_01075 [Candidatus Borkfalkia excrementavium]|uniref:Uncharacterized protein n=1 Tax=Candidatus Borkfalkia excrementavium TaxID=2838505 RepID=A0A9D1Z7E4_9FIRM|nr:hypothetical protein [Candidatus Borkfalkia excrementavium]